MGIIRPTIAHPSIALGIPRSPSYMAMATIVRFFFQCHASVNLKERHQGCWNLCSGDLVIPYSYSIGIYSEYTTTMVSFRVSQA